ncbi:MAG: beta-propeller domain-containing protein [Firmicutes bacterium]|nr:beta-propeller domain-containing protein [Bacillota bacterium]
MKKIIQLKRYLVILLTLILSLGLYACQDSRETSELPTVETVGNFKSYDELKTYLNSFYDKNDDIYLYQNSNMLAENTILTTGVYMSGAEDSSQSTTPISHSETNDQVEGVSESDRILTDGINIYVLSNQKFFIIDALSLEIVYSYTIENGYLTGMYLYNDKIVIIANEYLYDETKLEDVYYWSYYSYGTSVNVFDTSDMENISITKRVYFDSTYLVNSRMIDGYLYLVMDNYTINYGFSDDNFVPQYRDSTISSDLINLPAENIYYMPNDNQSFGYLLLASISVDTDEEANVKAYLGSSYQIYMSLNNLYTIIYRNTYDVVEQTYTYNTYILRFEIIENELVYQAIGKVNGSPLNQFSMDEYNGVFRIATTGYSYFPESWSITNELYLLDATSLESMTQIQTLSGLGKPGERIYAVRFSEDYAYVVTFIQTDPLYKLDLSDPENPLILGELYEDGVSDYLHEISDSLMIGVGRQAETSGDWTRFTGVKVAIYNTLEDIPVTLETYLVEGEYSYTDVQYDHKAFVTYEPDGADFMYVAIPIYEYYENYYQYSQSVYVFKAFYSGDLELVAKLSHYQEESVNYYWYFDSIDRTVMIGDKIYTVSYSKIQMYDMANDFQLLKSTELDPDYFSNIYSSPVSPID